ncbi:MAG: SCO family protein [Burkholderiales bacterium]|nr:SCO family protein [Burkholderiales bacterium]
MGRIAAGLLAAALVVSLAGCGPGAPQFKNTDLTGADYGKALRLTDHTGRMRSLEEFKGSAVVVFFGFTQCPDVCPTTLAGMKAVKQQLGEDGKRMQVLFVSVDPERDTQELLSQYVTAFDASFVGLRGDAEATARVAKDFKVFYQKVPGATPHTYTVDHSAGSYVFDPAGRLRLYVRHGQSPDAIAHDIELLLAGQ